MFIFKKMVNFFREKSSVVNENVLLKEKIAELEDMIEDGLKRRKKDFKEHKEYFNKMIEQKVNEVSEAKQTIIDKKDDEIKSLAKIIDENHGIVQAIKNQNIEINQLGDESVQRLKLANDFFQKGIQQMERIFTEFATHKRRFDEIAQAKIPRLRENTEYPIDRDEDQEITEDQDSIIDES